MDNGLTTSIPLSSGTTQVIVPPPPSRRQAAERYPNIYEYNLCVFTQTEVEVQMDS